MFEALRKKRIVIFQHEISPSIRRVVNLCKEVKSGLSTRIRWQPLSPLRPRRGRWPVDRRVAVGPQSAGRGCPTPPPGPGGRAAQHQRGEGRGEGIQMVVGDCGRSECFHKDRRCEAGMLPPPAAMLFARARVSPSGPGATPRGVLSGQTAGGGALLPLCYFASKRGVQQVKTGPLPRWGVSSGKQSGAGVSGGGSKRHREK